MNFTITGNPITDYLLIGYCIGIVIAFVVVLWDQSRCYDVMMSDLPGFIFAAVFWPVCVILFYGFPLWAWFFFLMEKASKTKILSARQR